MSNKALNIFYALCLIGLVGVMSWRDMHPTAAPVKVTTPTLFTYHAGADIPSSSAVPGDTMPVSVFQGMLAKDADGKVVWTPQGMAPATFVQRQVSLVLRLKALPPDPVETFRRIEERVNEWKRQGTVVAALVMEYAPEDGDFGAYADFLEAAYAHFTGKQIILAGTEDSALPAFKKADLGRMVRAAPMVLIGLSEPRISPERMAELKALEYGFILRFPVGVLPQDIPLKPFEDMPMFRGFSFTLDPHNPWPKKGSEVGLFPKF